MVFRRGYRRHVEKVESLDSEGGTLAECTGQALHKSPVAMDGNIREQRGLEQDRELSLWFQVGQLQGSLFGAQRYVHTVSPNFSLEKHEILTTIFLMVIHLVIRSEPCK